MIKLRSGFCFSNEKMLLFRSAVLMFTTTTDRLREVLGLDYRSLALFRIGLGLLLISDLIHRGLYLTAHYTDFGVLPRFAVLEYFADQWEFSLHMANGTFSFTVFLFLVAGAFALMMILGYKTRLATILSFIFLISLHNRNPLVLQGGDTLFKMILFWAMFLPLGVKYSLDSALNGHYKNDDKPFLSMASIGLYVQVMLIYITAVFHKSGADWWQDGTAVYYTLQIDELTTSFGKWLGTFPVVTTFLTRAVLVWQFTGAILLLNPFWFGPIRVAVILGFIALQAGFGSSMILGLFPWIAVVAMLGFLPAWFWDQLASSREGLRKGMKVYYDQDCGFCRKSVRLLSTFLMLKDVEVLSAQQDPSICSDMQEHNSWVIVDHKRRRKYHFDGFIHVVSASPVFFWLAPVFSLAPIHWIGTVVYRSVAARRSLQCQRPGPVCKPVLIRSLWITQVAALLAIVYIVGWNVSNVKKQEGWFPPDLLWIGRALSIDQEWNMFAPVPLREDGWHVIAATLRNGQEIDLLTGKTPVDESKPELVSALYPTQRWSKYMMNITEKKHSDYRLYFGQYLCRDWNARYTGQQQLMSFDILFFMEETLPDYRTKPVERMVLWQHKCFE